MSSRESEIQASSRATGLVSARVARIPYLNAAPYYVHWSRLATRTNNRWTSVELPPRQVGMAMERGDVDAGLMAVADLFRLGSTFEPLVLKRGSETISLGIANRDRVDSVLLFVRDRAADSDSDQPTVGRFALGAEASVEDAALELTPEDRDRLEGATIAITGESSTSVRLLRLLLEGRHRIRPTQYRRLDLSNPPPAPIEAALVIGDLALRWRCRPPAGWRQAMDLAREWSSWQNLPFVFARWAVRRELSSEDKESLAKFLEAALAEGAKRLGDHTLDLSPDLGTPRDLEFYLKNFIYELGPEEDRAETQFRSLLEEQGIGCTSG